MGAERKSLTQAIEKVAEDIYQQREKEKESNKAESHKVDVKENPPSK